MIYIIFKRGKHIDWDEIRIFTSYSIVEQLVTSEDFYVIAYEGEDQLHPVWYYIFRQGRLQRFSLSLLKS
jgi:hypothetical protein